MIQRVPRLLSAAFLIALASCGGGTEPGDGCASDVEVQVSAGSRPLVSWNSRCRAIGVRIIEAQRLFNNDLPVWEITASTSTIRPPVIVGDDVPGTIRSGLGPADLAAGRLYVALVSIGELGATPVRRDSLRFMVR